MIHNFLAQDIKLRRGCLVSYSKRSGVRFENVMNITKFVQYLDGKPIGHFPNLNSVAKDINVTLTLTMRQTIAYLILDVIDNNIQKVFKQYLTANIAAGTHQQKIGIIGKYNLEAITLLVNTIDWQWLTNWLGIYKNIQVALDDLSNFAYISKTVNFRTSYHCNIECKFCYNFSGPLRKSERIPQDVMLSVISDMKDAGMSRLIITGGEPFLNVKGLLEIITHAANNNVKYISILSNGFWGSTYDKAKEMILRLYDAGYHDKIPGKLKISNGVFHQEFLKIDGPLNIAKAHYDLFETKVTLDYEMYPLSEEGNLRSKLDEKLKEFELTNEMIEIKYRKALAIGRAVKNNIAVMKDATAFHKPCINSVNKLIIDPDKNMSVYPCCGQNYESKGLSIGNMKQHTLKDVVKLNANDSIIQFIVKNPFDQLFQYLPHKMETEYASICNVCLHALSNLEDREPLLAKLFEQQRFYPYWFKWVDGKVMLINHFEDIAPKEHLLQ